MARNVDAMKAQKMGLSPRKAMSERKIPAMKRGGRAKAMPMAPAMASPQMPVAPMNTPVMKRGGRTKVDRDDDGMSRGGKAKRK